MTEPLLEIRNVSKSFPGTDALVDVSLDMFPGEILGLVGANGAGKSTLTKIISGALQPDRGTLRLNGEEKQFHSVHEAIEAGISEAFQESTLVPDLNGWENIYLGQEAVRYGFVRNHVDRDRARSLVEQVGVNIDLTLRPPELGVGERKILEILRAWSREPELLILDEPTASLSETEIETVFELQRSLREQGLSILFISHHLDEIFGITDRVAVLRDGKLVGVEPTSDLSRSQLVDMMLETSLDEQFPSLPGKSNDPVLELREYSTPSLHDLELTVNQGEIVGLAGVVGSGRTELLETIVGSRRDHGGTLKLRGRSISLSSPYRARQNGVHLVPEDRHVKGLFPSLPIKNNLAMTIYDRISPLGFVNKRMEQERSLEVIEDLRIKCTGTNQEVKFLSGGNQQKVSFGKWLIQTQDQSQLRNQLFLLDKPTEGIDVGAKTEFYRLITTLARQGAGILLVSAELDELLNLCHRIYALARGTIVNEFPAQQVTKHDLQQAIG